MGPYRWLGEGCQWCGRERISHKMGEKHVGCGMEKAIKLFCKAKEGNKDIRSNILPTSRGPIR